MLSPHHSLYISYDEERACQDVYLFVFKASKDHPDNKLCGYCNLFKHGPVTTVIFKLLIFKCYY
jgi:hypothetical protein